MFALIQVGEKRFLYLITKIDDVLVSTLATHLDCEIIKIYVADIQTDTLRYTDSGSEKKSKNRKIPIFCLLIIGKPLTGEILPAMIYIVKKHGNFIRIKTYDRFFMQFWHINQ